MREPLLSYAEAKAICCDHQYLVGHAFTTEPTDFSIIECVAIVPHDEVNKWIFANYYMQGMQPGTDGGFEHYPYYDVIVLARYKSGDSILYADLQNYLQQKQHLNMTVEAQAS